MVVPEAARILLVDDHPIVRMALRLLLVREPDFVVCGEAQSIEEAILAVSSQKPDLVVMDLSMGGAGGLELIRRLNKLDAGLPVLVFTLYDEAAFADLTFAAGARGYVTKQESPEALIRAIRHVLAGGIYLGRPPSDT